MAMQARSRATASFLLESCFWRFSMSLGWLASIAFEIFLWVRRHWQ